MAHIVDGGDNGLTRDRSVRLENDTWDRLNRLAQITELPVSWHIRRAVRNYLALLDAAPPFEADIARWMADPAFAREYVATVSEITKAPGQPIELRSIGEDQAAQSISPPTLAGVTTRPFTPAESAALDRTFTPAPKPTAKPKGRGLRSR